MQLASVLAAFWFLVFELTFDALRWIWQRLRLYYREFRDNRWYH